MKVFVDVHYSRWKKYKIDFEKIVCMAVSGVHSNSEVSIILVDDKEIQSINCQYRNIDKPTNVLSFELGDDILLGDIYISLDTVLREAKDLNISVYDHVAHMVVHGTLHLLGYDHITDEEATVMELKETKILKKMNIKNPYADNKIVCADASCCPGSKIISMLKSINIKENGFFQYLLYAGFGAVASLGFAPFYQWWWTLIGIGGAYWLTVRNNNIGGFWKRFLRVFPFGAMYGFAMFWWVLHSIYVVPDLTAQYAIWTIPGALGLMLAGGLIFSWPLVAVAGKKRSPAARVWMFACVWSLVLWLREWLFTGFPWNPIANIFMPFPVIVNSMSVWGALGLSFIVTGVVASVVELLLDKKNKSVFVTFLLFVCFVVYGGFCGKNNIKAAGGGAENDATILRIVQPAASQSEKATHNRAEALKRAQENLKKILHLASASGDYDILVLPETSYPFVVMATDNIDIASFVKKPVIFGANTFDMGAIYNSLIVSAENGRIEKIYNKSHLVPFGEYRPLGFLPAPVNLTPGNGPDVIGIDGFVFVPAICYEIIFSDSLLPENSGEVHGVVNITNDNWFGKTPGTYQHFDMVRRYAIESGLPIVRANYSGISAFVASDGEIISALPVGQAGILDGFVWGAHNTLYRKIGLNRWMIIILIVSILGVRIFATKKD